MADNIYTTKGTIFSIDLKTGESKKEGEPNWELYIVKIESEANVGGKKVSSVCEFTSNWGVSLDGYYTKDFVEIEWFFMNRSVKKKDGGTWVKEEKKIAWIGYGNMTTPPPPKTIGNKVQVGSMTNTKELTSPQLKPDVFDQPRPSELVKQDDDDLGDDLPF